MKFTFEKSSNSAFWACFLIFISKSTGGLAIIGGFPAEDYPFLVNVNLGKRSCCGTIIEVDAIVTAAHCLYYDEHDRWADPREIRVRKQKKGSFSRLFWAERFVFPRQYDPYASYGYGAYDVAVVILRDTFDLSKPENRAIRPCRAIFDYPQGIAIGTGASKMDQVGLTNAVKEVKLYRNMFCRRPLKEFHNITIDDVKQICYWHHNSDIKHTESIAGTYVGDFGGPLVYRPEAVSKQCLIGIASFSVSTYRGAMLISVYSRASIFSKFFEEAML